MESTYHRICSNYEDFITTRLIKQGFLLVKSFYVKYIHLMDKYNV